MTYRKYSSSSRTALTKYPPDLPDCRYTAVATLSTQNAYLSNHNSLFGLRWTPVPVVNALLSSGHRYLCIGLATTLDFILEFVIFPPQNWSMNSKSAFSCWFSWFHSPQFILKPAISIISAIDLGCGSHTKGSISLCKPNQISALKNQKSSLFGP